MLRAAVFLCLLVSADLEMTGATGKTSGSVVEKVETTDTPAGATDTTHVNDTGLSAFRGNLLVVPMDGSHWVGIKAIAQEMGRRGHRVTVVIPEISMRMGPGKHYNTVTFPVPYEKDFIYAIMSKQSDALRKSAQPFMEKIQMRISQIKNIVGIIHITAESLLFNVSLISHLSQQNFDAVLTDPLVPTGSLIARKLGIPTINLLRGIPCSLDMKAAGCPSPPSYVPHFFSGYTDKMSFTQRIVNTVVSHCHSASWQVSPSCRHLLFPQNSRVRRCCVSVTADHTARPQNSYAYFDAPKIALLEPLLCRLLYWHFDQIAYDFLGEEVGVAEVLSDSAIWLLRSDITLEFPRPLMPNIVLVGGINCKVRNPLPEDLESWVSGEHGFIVFTLGSMVSVLPEEMAEVFLEAFRQIPQKVIWRHTGPLPDNVPENVKIMKWVPQNDLLAHRGVRAFITHAGSHGLFEGLCHAVPMLMVPIAGDQHDNARRMASRGVGVVLDIFSITTESLLQGLNDVINNTKYKETMEKLSALHNDRPIDPLELSVYWTEFVMRHKGAKHLKAAVHHLNWFQYFSLDVIAFLTGVVLVVAMVTVKCMKLCLRKLSRKRKQD